MSFFTQALVSQLYLAGERITDRGSLAFVLPQPPDRDLPGIDLDEALHSGTLAGIFVFSARKLVFADSQAAQTFVDEILRYVGARRALLWLTDLRHFTDETAPLMGINNNGTRVSTGLAAPLTATLRLNIQND